MFKLKLSRKNLMALLMGYLVIFTIGILIKILSFVQTQLAINSLQHVSLEALNQKFSEQPYDAFSWLLRILSFLSLISGGFVVGWKVKERGWVYGGLLGFLIKLIGLTSILIIAFLPASFVYGVDISNGARMEQVAKKIFFAFIELPLAVLLIGLGGYLGEFFYKKNSKRK